MEMNLVVELDMHAEDDEDGEQPDADHPLFAVVLARVLNQQHRPGEDPRRVGEIKVLAYPEPGLSVTISAGISEYGRTDVDALVDAADRKLYEAKAAGRDRVVG